MKESVGTVCCSRRGLSQKRNAVKRRKMEIVKNILFIDFVKKMEIVNQMNFVSNMLDIEIN